MKTKAIKFMLLATLLASAVGVARLSWAVSMSSSAIASGGGSSTNSGSTNAISTAVSVTGTIGQAAASTSGSTNQNGSTNVYLVASGFWPAGVFSSSEPTNCLTIACSNIIVTTCSNCAQVPLVAAVSDGCCTNPDWIFVFDSGYVQGGTNNASFCFPVNTTTEIEVLAFDNCENQVSNYFSVTVVPGLCLSNCLTMVCPSNILAVTCSNGINVSFPEPLVNDPCCTNGTVNYSFNPPSGSFFGLGVHTVEATATDSCGNTGTCSFAVQVVEAVDPVAYLNTNEVVAYACDTGCGRIPDATGAVTVAGGNTGWFPPSQTPAANSGTICANTNVLVIVSNICGWSTNFYVGVKLQEVCTNLTSCLSFSCPPNIVLTNCGSSPVPVFYEWICGTVPCCGYSEIIVCYDPPSGSLFAPTGAAQPVTATVSDLCGDTNTCTFYVTVFQDTNPPVVIVPTNVSVCVGSTTTGRLVVDGGPWDFSEIGFCSEGDGHTYATNLAAYLTRDGLTRGATNILIYSADYLPLAMRGNGDELYQVLTNAGYNVVEDTGIRMVNGQPQEVGFAEPLSYYLDNFQFDAVFLAGGELYTNGVDQDFCTLFLTSGCDAYPDQPPQFKTSQIPALLNYITNGGGVFVALGKGNQCANPSDDAGYPQWSEIMNPFGLAMSDPQTIDIDVPHACDVSEPFLCSTNSVGGGTNLFVTGGSLTVVPSLVTQGITNLFYRNLNEVSLTGSSPIARLVAFTGSYGLIGISSCIVATNNGCGVMPNLERMVQVEGGGPYSVVQNIPPGTEICSNTTVTLTISNICGQLVTTNVEVTLGPSCATCLAIECPSNIVLTCQTNGTTVNYPAPVVTDYCCTNSSIRVVYNPPEGTVFQPNTITPVTETVIDQCSNSATCTFTVTVLPGPEVKYVGNSLYVTNGAPDYDSPFVILGEYSPSGPLPYSVKPLPTGTVEDVQFYGQNYDFTLYALSYVASGAGGEQTFEVMASQTYSDSAVPFPTNHVLPVGFCVQSNELLAFAGIGPWYSQNPDDQNDTDATYESAYPYAPGSYLAIPPAGGTGPIITLGPNPDLSVNYEYIDNSPFANQGRTYGIGVDVALASRCSVCSGCLTIDCNSNVVAMTCSNSALVCFNVTANDSCTSSNNVHIVTMPPSCSEFPPGETLVHCIAWDNLGNTQSCNFTVSVLPCPSETNCITLLCPSNITVITCSNSAVVYYPVHAFDNCTTNQGVTYLAMPPSGSEFPLGTHTVYEVAFDGEGNSNECSFTVTVVPCTVPPPSNSFNMTLTGINATASPPGGGNFSAVDTTGFFGPAGSNIFLSPAQIGLYTGSGSATANLGNLDESSGAFSMNWGGVAGFVVYDSTGHRRVGTGQLFLVSPETGYVSTNGLGYSQTAGPVPVSMVLENLNGGVLEPGDGWVININYIHVPLPIPPCCNPVSGSFDTSNVPLTIGLPAVMGGGSISATLNGGFEMVSSNMVVPLSAPVSSSAVPVLLSGLNTTAVPSNNPAGNFAATDLAGFWGPTGNIVYLSPLQFQGFDSAGVAPGNMGYIDPVEGTFSMNWGEVGTFQVFDHTGSNQVGSGMLQLVSSQTGTYDASNQVVTSATVEPGFASWVLYNNSGGVAVEPDDDSGTFHGRFPPWFNPNIPWPGPWCPACSNQVTVLLDTNTQQSTMTITTPTMLGSQFTATLNGGSAAIAAQIPSATVNFGSFVNRSVGNAAVALSSNQVVASNLGTSGLDGLAINPGAAVQAMALHWQDPDPSNSLPVGAYMEARLFGTGGTVSNGWLGSIKVLKQGSSNYVTMANFAPMGASNVTFQVLAAGSPVGPLTTNLNGVMTTATRWGWDFEYLFNPETLHGRWWVTYNGQLVQQQGPYGGPVYGDTLEITTPQAPPVSLSSVELLASGVPQLVVSNESASLSLGALQATLLGGATATTAQPGQLILGNLGASGQDGVAINLGGGPGLSMHWENLDPSNSLPVGAYLEEAFYGTGGSVTQSLLGTVQITKSNSTSWAYSADFSPMGVSNILVQVLTSEDPPPQVVSSTVGHNGLLYSTMQPLSDCHYMNTANGHPIGPVILTMGGANVGITLASGDPTGDAVALTPLDASGKPQTITFSEVELFAANIPAIFSTNVNETADYGGVDHFSLGNATLNVQSNQLTVANLGSSGQDGVSIALPTVSEWAAQWADPDPSNSLPVGAYLQLQEIGTANGVTNDLLGTITITKLPGSCAVSADYSPAGVSTYNVELMSGTNVVGEEDSVTNGILYYCWSSESGPTFVVTDIRYYGYYQEPTHKLYTVADFDGIQGDAVPCDRALIIPQGLDAGLPTTVMLRASQIPSLVMTNELVSPLSISYTLVGVGLELQWAGTGILQSSTDLSTWTDMPNAASPYFTTMGTGKQFYRIRQPLGGEIGF